jgi:L-asparagine transporter-like permease
MEEGRVVGIKTFNGEQRDLPWYVLSDEDNAKLNAGMVLVAFTACMFLVLFVSIMTWLAIKGEYPVSLLTLVYGVITLGIYAVYRMCKTQRAFNKMMDEVLKGVSKP